MSSGYQEDQIVNVKSPDGSGWVRAKFLEVDPAHRKHIDDPWFNEGAGCWADPSHAAHHTSCFLNSTDPPTCRCNHLCHDGGAEICTGGADEQYTRLGHNDEVVERGNVCHACAAAMVKFAERD